MSMKTLERAILTEAQKVTGNKKLKMKDIMEWSTGNITVGPNEKFHHLPKLGVKIAIKNTTTPCQQNALKERS